MIYNVFKNLQVQKYKREIHYQAFQFHHKGMMVSHAAYKLKQVILLNTNIAYTIGQ